MKRLAGLIAVLTLGALVFAGKADATQPFMQRMPQDAFELVNMATGETTCDFPVLIEPTAPDVLNFFIFSDGKIAGAGPFVGTATNVDTGKTIRLNNPGHFSVVSHSDGTTTFTTDGTVISSFFGLITIGHSVIELDANGGVNSSTSVGRQVDLCAELAGP